MDIVLIWPSGKAKYFLFRGLTRIPKNRSDLTTQKRLVEAGFGVALLAESGIQEELRQGTLKLPNVPALRAGIPVAMVLRRNG